MTRHLRVLFTIFLLSVLVAACTAPAAEAPAATESDAETTTDTAADTGEMDPGEPQTGGTLRAAFQNEWAGLIPM